MSTNIQKLNIIPRFLIEIMQIHHLENNLDVSGHFWAKPNRLVPSSDIYAVKKKNKLHL